MKIILSIAVFLTSLCFSELVLAKQPPQILTTIRPIHSLISAVVGDDKPVGLIIDDNSSPHDFQLKPSQMKLITEADVIFYVSDNFETFLNSAMRASSQDLHRENILRNADLEILEKRAGGNWEEDDHHTHHHDEDHDTAHHVGDDMHVWLNPENAIKIVEFAAVELGKIFPQSKPLYEANAQLTIQRIKQLDEKLRTKLSTITDKPFIVFHDAYQYFEHHYGLKAAGSITLEPNEAASPKRIAQIRQKIAQARISCVFKEPGFSNRLISTIAEGNEVTIGVMDPLGTELTPGSELYFYLMEKMADSLSSCLEG